MRRYVQWDTGTEMWTVDDSRWGKVGRVRREAEKLWYIETTSKLSKVKISQIFEFAAIARFSIGLCVCWRSSKVTCYWSKLNQSISRRPGEVHRFTVFCWFKHGFAKSDSVTLRWFQYHLLSSKPLLPQVGVGPVMPTIWHDPWLPKAHDLGRQVAVLRGTAYATPGKEL